ncbi:metal ABC transporter substrate-binding protein [Sinomonas halotolerans]|uniref:Zinc ABC transporter substrate-binding protein n=1 Tax=Sinomonas halotolerans TaxID=1644133 RepID=A0ABU9WXI5_9MICC
MRSSLLRAAAGGVAAASLVLTACAPSRDAGAADGRIAVVASTNVYGSLVEEIGGDRVEVTSIVSKPTQDPHSYEATAQDRLAVSKARLVVENGGGFDAFIAPLLEESGVEKADVVTAVEVAGLEPGTDHADASVSPGTHAEETASGASADAHAEETASGASADAHAEETAGAHADHAHAFNEHVWYDVHAMGEVAEAIAERLGALDPESAPVFAERAAGIAKRLGTVEETLTGLKDAHGGQHVVMTEPVPFYLLEAAGLEDATPEEFIEAVEEEQDAPPAALKETLDLVASGEVRVLAYNPQTEGTQTRQVRAAAEAAGVEVVEFTETLPEGTDYASWMEANATALADALAKASA